MQHPLSLDSGMDLENWLVIIIYYKMWKRQNNYNLLFNLLSVKNSEKWPSQAPRTQNNVFETYSFVKHRKAVDYILSF